MNRHELLGHFKGVIDRGNGQYQALCPAHDDKNPSLSIKCNPDGTFLVYCHAGCSYKSIMAAAELDSKLFSMDGNWKFVAEYFYTCTLKKVRYLKPDKTKTCFVVIGGNNTIAYLRVLL